MKFLARIALFIATALLLGHNVSPHFHGDYTEHHICAEEPVPSSILHLITCFFHVDLGEDHLEGFNVSSSVDLSFTIVQAPVIDLFLKRKSETPPFIANRLSGPSTAAGPSLRGPPEA